MITITNAKLVRDPESGRLAGMEFTIISPLYVGTACYYADQSLRKGVLVGTFPPNKFPSWWDFEEIQGEPISCDSEEELNSTIEQVLKESALLSQGKTLDASRAEILMDQIQEHRRELEKAQVKVKHIESQIEQKRDQLFELQKGIGDPPSTTTPEELREMIGLEFVTIVSKENY